MMSDCVDYKISVSTPARLHLGFIDLHGGSGRKFGSVGIAIDSPRLELDISPADKFNVYGADSERIARLAASFDRYHGVESRCSIHIKRTIAAHSGLGSGTQTALAVGHGLAKLHGLTVSTTELAHCLERGRRSGIGIYAFDHGGTLVDGGVKDGHLPTLIFRHPFPNAWRIVLIIRRGENGLHGAREQAAFARLPQFSKACAGVLSHTVVMQLMPAIVECNFDDFNRAVGKLQDTMKNYFSAVQRVNESPTSSDKLLEYLKKQGITGSGQTSWGPTAFVIMENYAQAKALKSQLIDYVQSCRRTEVAASSDADAIDFLIVSGDNEGAAVAMNEQ